jgi:hypothetical protein
LNTLSKLSIPDDKKRRRQFLVETMIPFCIGLAMLIAGTYYYIRS